VRLRHLHEHTVASLNSGLLTTDTEGRVRSLNPEAERISGRKLAEVLGRDLEEVLPGVRDALRMGVETPSRGRVRARMPLLHRSGQKRHLGLAS
jgi:PAS domain S-box-containing protein